MKPVFHSFAIDGVKGLAIYRYEEPIREKLYKLKGCSDIEIAPVFLEYFLPYLRLRYLGYRLVPAPSFFEADRQRGFNHIEEIFRSLGLKELKCIRKTSPVKQADLDKKARAGVLERLALEEDVDVKGRRLLIVDDVMTTGSTLRAMISLLRPLEPKRLAVLVVSYVSNET